VALSLLMLAGAAAWRLAGIVVLALAVTGLAIALRMANRRRRTTRATLGLMGHVVELRDRVLWCVASWTAATLVVFSVRIESRQWPWGLPWGFTVVPALQDNVAAQVYRAMASWLVPDGVRLVVLKPLDGFSAEFTIAMGLGFAIALPVILWQLGAFVGPALRPRERRILRITILPAVALFAAGATFAATILAPVLLATLYGYPEALGAEPLLLVGELVSFVVALAVVFGLASLTPMVMAGLSAAGLVGWRTLLRGWRHATVASVVVCAFATDGTLVTLLMVAAPLMALYFLGVAVAAWVGPRANAAAV
jgi:sec-independent protein translocase protein TatC